jgi:hypothetical protein
LTEWTGRCAKAHDVLLKNAFGREKTMKKKRPVNLCAVLICSVGILFMSRSFPAMALERISPTSNESIRILSSVLSFHRGEYSSSGPEIKIFEIGGGDPAMNGAYIYVCIDSGQKVLVWKTGMNVRSLDKITYAPGNVIMLDVNEDFMDKNASIVNQKATYRMQFNIVGGVLQDTLVLEKQKVKHQ